MATDILQHENQAIDAARQAMDQAIEEFEQQLKAYEQFGKKLVEDMQHYRELRGRWLL